MGGEGEGEGRIGKGMRREGHERKNWEKERNTNRRVE